MGVSPLHKYQLDHGVKLITLGAWQATNSYGDPNREALGANNNVLLVDVTYCERYLVQSSKDLQGQLLDYMRPPSSQWHIGDGVRVESGSAFRLRTDLCLIQFALGANGAWVAGLQNLPDDPLVSVLDITHGSASLQLIGPKSALLLSRLCGLNFDLREFPNFSVRQSSVAKTRQILIRNDIGEIPAYSLVGDRSLAVYLWETITKAGGDLGLVHGGLEVLSMLNG